MLLAVLETGVNVTHHEDHVAGGHLLPLFIGGLVALHVAVVAPSLVRNAQGLHEGLHGVREGVLVEHLKVLGGIPTTFPNTLATALGIGRLGWTCECTEQEECGDG